MKIVHIITTLGYGGAEKVCMDLTSELAKHEDLQIYLISLVDHTPAQRSLSALDKRVTFISAGKKPGFDIKVFSRIDKILQKIQPDIINTHLTGLFFSLKYILKQKNPVKTRFFHTLHNPAAKDVHLLANYFHKYLFKRNIVKPIALTEEIRKSASQYFKIRNIPCIHNGIPVPQATSMVDRVAKEVESYKPFADTKVFINLARIHPQKNQEMLIRVFNRLQDKNVILLILGSCTEKNEDLLKRLKHLANPNIHFLGKKDNAVDYLIHADVFCLSSQFEGLPLSLLEAIALKKVTICTPVGGIPSVIQNGYNGLLSQSESEEDYYKILLDFFSLSDTKIADIQMNGYQTFTEKFTMASCATAYLNLYKTSL